MSTLGLRRRCCRGSPRAAATTLGIRCHGNPLGSDFDPLDKLGLSRAVHSWRRSLGPNLSLRLLPVNSINDRANCEASPSGGYFNGWLLVSTAFDKLVAALADLA